ncbi:selenocysteine-specific elongation factor [Nocardioides anomalus]|uniref:Selenocysteine-specific elongation factor n=1 Tax=Nocardioides anomalus TaxID=2712223 RepID=A0A6G6WCD6_9ACTN|nr:selenocysteine-specific translation elongation factor [Nocardioides anomalus]QIG42813.1 selenocysteine-specific elongation factor [Nocardioides anomalus]
MHVVTTAGHVDHGKSALIRALTGRDPDRLEEERRRGLSIELGYAWAPLAGVGDVAYVDVPGHQRFLTTALAGMGPVPVALFVVAADDPWMPQAEEHLAALDALGVRHGLLAVTRSDLADPAPALEAARSRLAATGLASAPHVVVSARTGAGLDALRSTLAGVLRGVPAPDPAAPVRLWVDRRFHVRGAGTVVTGTLPEGTVRAGDRLAFGDEPVRVRGIESLEVSRTEVTGVARVALDLGGHAPAGIARGSALVTPGAFISTAAVDVRLDGGGEPPERPVLHVGSASAQVRLRPLGRGYARLQLPEPVPLRAGDRAVLRDPGSREVWGVVVLDAAPPALSRRGDAARRARVLSGEEAEAVPEPAPAAPVAAPVVEDPAAEAALERLREHLADAPFDAPDAPTLTAYGLDDGTAARLHRDGRVLRVAPGVVLLPDAADLSVDVLAGLQAPFTTSAARQALGTSRRVALPLLLHLDKTGRTVRLADDTRRLRGS